MDRRKIQDAQHSFDINLVLAWRVLPLLSGVIALNDFCIHYHRVRWSLLYRSKRICTPRTLLLCVSTVPQCPSHPWGTSQVPHRTTQLAIIQGGRDCFTHTPTAVHCASDALLLTTPVVPQIVYLLRSLLLVSWVSLFTAVDLEREILQCSMQMVRT